MRNLTSGGGSFRNARDQDGNKKENRMSKKVIIITRDRTIERERRAETKPVPLPRPTRPSGSSGGSGSSDGMSDDQALAMLIAFAIVWVVCVFVGTIVMFKYSGIIMALATFCSGMFWPCLIGFIILMTWLFSPNRRQ
jgi:hypothetical protein